MAPRGGGQDEVVLTKRPFAVPLPEQVIGVVLLDVLLNSV